MTPSPNKSTWRFERNPLHIVSRNRVSTDALSVLESWKLRGSDRSFIVIDGLEAEDYLVAELGALPGDIDAGIGIESLCAEFGVRRLPG